MKRYLLLTFMVILVFTATNSLAQDGKFGISVEGGPSCTYMYKSNMTKSDFLPIVGGYAGVYFNYQFKKHFAFTPGLAWEEKGCEYKPKTYGGTFNDPTFDFIIRVDYLTLPLLLKASFGDQVRFICNAGPYFGILLKQNYINVAYKSWGNGGLEIDPSTYTQRLPYDLGFTGSLGLEVALGKRMGISLTLSDHLSLINTKVFPVIKDGSGETYNTDRTSCFNSAVASLGFSLFFGKEKETRNKTGINPRAEPWTRVPPRRRGEFTGSD